MHKAVFKNEPRKGCYIILLIILFRKYDGTSASFKFWPERLKETSIVPGQEVSRSQSAVFRFIYKDRTLTRQVLAWPENKSGYVQFGNSS